MMDLLLYSVATVVASAAGHEVFKREAEEEAVEEKTKEEKEEKEEEKGESFGNKVKHVGEAIKEEFEKDVDKLAEVTHMKPWMILAILAAIVLVVVALVGWCVWRFCKKKRPKGNEKGAGQGDDENALVDNEEAQAEEVEEKQESESRGRIRFKLEYDFTLQELRVTVIECAELPPTDWSTGLTDPFVKVYLLPDKKPKYETKVHRKNLNPKFDQTFIFKNIAYVDTFDKTLVFAVYDYDRFSACDQTGEYQLPLNSVDLAGPIEEWKDLAPVDDGSNQYLGDLCLSLRYVPSSGKLTVAVLEARKLKKMDITGASDPYVKLKLFDSKGKRIGKKKKTSVKSCNLNPYWNESFVFLIDEMDMKRVVIDVTVCDYDLIGGGDPIGKIKLGWNQSKEYKPGFKHWKEVLENPRRPIIKWHVLQNPEPEEEDDKKKDKDKDKKKDDKKDKDKKDDKKDEKDALPSQRYLEHENVEEMLDFDQFYLESETSLNRLKRQEYDADDETETDDDNEPEAEAETETDNYDAATETEDDEDTDTETGTDADDDSELVENANGEDTDVAEDRQEVDEPEIVPQVFEKLGDEENLKTVPIGEEIISNESTALEEAPEESENSETVPDETEASEAVPDETEASEGAPGEAESSEVVSEKAEPSEEAPEESEAAEVVPDETDIADVVPEETETTELVPKETEIAEVVPEEIAEETSQEHETQEVSQESEVSDVVPEESETEEVIPTETETYAEVATEIVPEEAATVEETFFIESATNEAVPEEFAIAEEVSEESEAPEVVPAETEAGEEKVTEESIPAEIESEAQVEDTQTEEIVPEAHSDENQIEEVVTEAPSEEGQIEEIVPEAPSEESKMEEIVPESTEVAPETELGTEEGSDLVTENISVTETPELDEVEKLLQFSDGTTSPPPECASTKFGCCPDNSPAHGPRNAGCCLSSQFGCCHHDFITPASGPDQAGCNCTVSEFGCCPDSLKAASGPNNDGCGCNFSPHGCCPDQVSAASGPEMEGCHCMSHDYGCCPDGITIAQGPKLEGCSGCEASEHGCCEDGYTPASGPDFQGCGCAGSQFGCCPDGIKNAEGSAFEGCGEIPGESCFLGKDAGTCKENFSVRWFFDIEYGGCSRFWYAQCKDGEDRKAVNRFSDQDTCEKMCVKPVGSGRCYLPKVRGPCEAAIPSWYFDKQWNQCMQFNYGGCLGNANRFETRQACQESCIHSEDVAVCSQPVEPGPCRGEFPRFYYDDEQGVCKSFNYTGCKGNTNRFSTLESCDNSCKHHSLLITAKRRCSMPKKTGSAQCNKKEAKWYFDTKAKGCRPFVYTGCEGNDNMFNSAEECERACPNAFPPEIEVFAKLVIAEEGNEAILQVKVEANPPPTVWWQFEDVKVEYSDRISKLGDGSLRIATAEMNDTGSWTIVADNRLGQVARKQVALKVHPNQMPIEVTIPKDKNVFKYGKDITLACQVKGYPIPVIRWYKNNTPVPKSTRITTLDDNTLVITKSSSIDGGSYSCRATNEHESVSDKIDIKVEKVQATKECIDKPRFAKCDLIVRAKFCNKNPYYAEFCCQSCTSAGQLTPPKK